MLFVTFAKARGTATMRERIARRIEYSYPEEIKVLGEYWPISGDDPSVVLVTQADDIQPVMTAVTDWSDLFDITTFPAVTAEQGLGLAKEYLATHHPAELVVR